MKYVHCRNWYRESLCSGSTNVLCCCWLSTMMMMTMMMWCYSSGKISGTHIRWHIKHSTLYWMKQARHSAILLTLRKWLGIYASVLVDKTFFLNHHSHHHHHCIKYRAAPDDTHFAWYFQQISHIVNQPVHRSIKNVIWKALSPFLWNGKVFILYIIILQYTYSVEMYTYINTFSTYMAIFIELKENPFVPYYYYYSVQRSIEQVYAYKRIFCHLYLLSKHKM